MIRDGEKRNKRKSKEKEMNDRIRFKKLLKVNLWP